MAQTKPGWYPDPTDPGTELYWDGAQWHGSRAAKPRSEQAKGQKPRERLNTRLYATVGLGAIALVGVIWWAAAAGLQQPADADQTPSATGVRPTAEASEPPAQVPVSTPSPTQAEEAPSNVIPLGQTLDSTSFALTINSAVVLDSIQTTDGAPITPDSGTELVLVHATYTVNGPNGVDLSCGNYDMFVRAYDSDGNEMAPLFEESRIPGNQPCNEKIVTGQTADWISAYKMVQGHEPGGFVVIDTNFHGPDAWGDEQLMALR